MRIAALSAPSSGSSPVSGASMISDLADPIGSKTKIASVTEIVFIYDCSDMCRLNICFCDWCAAYHASGAVQYNIGGGAHGLSRHLDGEGDDTADRQRGREFKQDAIGGD